MASEQNIKVAVRLRPFISSIKNEAEGRVKRIVRMDELSSSVSVTNPDNRLDTQAFAFDAVLWSFDGFSEQADGYICSENKAASEEIYCDQKQVYDELGKEAVQNLWNGYNSTIFTFGESNSGKSWTLLGLGTNKGIVPQSLTELFKGIRERASSQQNGSFEVRLSMAEIYNEKIKDLLPASSSSSSANSYKFKNSLKIREHSKKGFYIEGLRTVLAVSHEDVQQRLEEGLVNRAMYLTNVNGTAGNSMTIIYVTLVQKIRNHRGDEMTRSATLEFIDLPCCEFRCPPPQSGVEQDDDACSRMINSPFFIRKNGINELVGCVNSVLESSSHSSNDNIPFHGHSVTKLMRNGLVGNARSFMIATLSPSEEAYQRTVFILKFAERVRMLSTRSTVNEEVTSKMVRELKGENEKLRKVISLGDFEGSNDLSSRLLDGLAMTSPVSRDAVKRRIVDDLKGQVRENEKEIRSLQQSLDERLRAFKAEKNDVGKKVENDRKSKPHVFNLSSDSQITGRIVLIIPLGTIDFGHLASGKGREHFISFCGPGIQDHHGTFTYNPKDSKFSIKPSGPNCKILVNSTPIQFDTPLGNNDRIILGSSQAWVFQNPKDTWLDKYSSKFVFQDVIKEASRKSEFFNTLARHLESDCQTNQLVSLLPCIEDAKTISEDLNQNVMIHPVLQQPVELLAGASNDEKATSHSDNEVDEDNDKGKGSNILVRVQNLVDGTYCYWSVSKFLDRLELLKGSYIQFLEDGDIPLKELDAFKERLDPDVPMGSSLIPLKPIAYLMNIENPSVPILDYISYQPIGSVNFSLCFSDDSGGKLNDLEVFVESPDELLDQTLDLVMSVQGLQFSHQFKEIYCKYKFLNEDEEITKVLDAKTSNFITGLGTSKYERRISLGPVTDNVLSSLITQCLVLRFFGKQRTHKLLNLVENNDLHNESYLRASVNPVDMELTLSQLKINDKSEQRHQRRLNAFKALVEQSEALGEDSIPLTFIKSLFQAKSQNLVNQSLEEHKELLTPIPEEPENEKQLPPELKALKRFSEICSIS